jgi:hypothetical protein
MSSSAPHDMRCCWRCGLLFDVEPVEIGRHEIDPNICIICADDIQRTAPRRHMDILTTTKTIKVHTLRIDDSEIERYMNDRDAWVDVLSTLLTAKPEPNGHTPPKKKRRHTKRAAGDEDTIDCPKCGMQVKPRGLLIHQHGSKCRARAGISTIPD